MAMPAMANADRIVPAAPPPPVAPGEAPTDILDLKQSPMAQNLAELLQAAASDVRNEALQRMTHPGVITPAPSSVPAAPIMPSISNVTEITPTDIIKLATKSDDLKVSTIAAQANRAAVTSSQEAEVPN